LSTDDVALEGKSLIHFASVDHWFCCRRKRRTDLVTQRNVREI